MGGPGERTFTLSDADIRLPGGRDVFARDSVADAPAICARERKDVPVQMRFAQPASGRI